MTRLTIQGKNSLLKNAHPNYRHLAKIHFLIVWNFRSEESDGDAPGEEPEKEKKKRKLVYREPRNKLTGVKQVKKTKKNPKPAIKLENLETRKSNRQTTIDQRPDADEYKPEKETRKRPVKKQRQMTQGKI